MAEEKEISAFSQIPEIIYEDDGILALNKPAGLMVHGDGRSPEKTLADWFLDHYPEAREVGEKLILDSGEEVLRSGIVHRLDRWTSGIMLAAKTQKAYLHLKKQFQNREIKKTYIALVYGHVREDFGTINSPLGRSKGDFRQYTNPPNPRGEMREAQTYYEVIERLETKEGKVTHLKAMPKTGRTHQIRVHLKSIGHPVLCDRVYAKEKPCILGFDRTALHAKEIVFKNLLKKEVKVKAPFPMDFNEAFENISRDKKLA